MLQIIGFLLLPLVWYILKNYLQISDRYLPSITSVLKSYEDIEPSIAWHFAFTASRFFIGYIFGLFLGIGLGLTIFKFQLLFDLSMPSIQATRSIPAVAVVPFFLLWFGFSELGRYLLIISGTSFNIAVAAYQILQNSPEKYKVMFQSFALSPRSLIRNYALPIVLEQILPTLRFSLSIAIGLIVASELLGSQIGLGYLIQTSRSTFSMHVIFFATLLLGVLNVAADGMLRLVWRKLVYWR